MMDATIDPGTIWIAGVSIVVTLAGAVAVLWRMSSARDAERIAELRVAFDRCCAECSTLRQALLDEKDLRMVETQQLADAIHLMTARVEVQTEAIRERGRE